MLLDRSKISQRSGKGLTESPVCLQARHRGTAATAGYRCCVTGWRAPHPRRPPANRASLSAFPARAPVLQPRRGRCSDLRNLYRTVAIRRDRDQAQAAGRGGVGGQNPWGGACHRLPRSPTDMSGGSAGMVPQQPPGGTTPTVMRPAATYLAGDTPRSSSRPRRSSLVAGAPWF